MTLETFIFIKLGNVCHSKLLQGRDKLLLENIIICSWSSMDNCYTQRTVHLHNNNDIV